MCYLEPTRATTLPNPVSRAVSEEEYWALPGWHSTELGDAHKLTGRGFVARYPKDAPRQFEPNEAMRQGSLVDCLITQPSLFDQRYAIRPDDLPKRPTELQLETGENSRPGTKARAAWEDAQSREAEWLAWEKESQGRETVPAGWVERAEQIQAVLLGDSEVGARLRDASPSCQEGWLWHDPVLGPCLYKPDLETQSGGLLDLKKSRSANPRMFSRAVLEFCYDLQASHYQEGFISRHWGPPTELGWIVYEFEPPFDFALIFPDRELVEHGGKRRHEAFEKITAWRATDDLPSYPVTTVSLPAWVKGHEPEPTPLTMDEIKLF